MSGGFYRDGRWVDTSETPWGESYGGAPATSVSAPTPDRLHALQDAVARIIDRFQPEPVDPEMSAIEYLDAKVAELLRRVSAPTPCAWCAETDKALEVFGVNLRSVMARSNQLLERSNAAEQDLATARAAIQAMSEGDEAEVRAIMAMAVRLVDDEHARVLLRHVTKQAERMEAARAALREAEQERDDAVQWIGVVITELVEAGGASGDRTVALANLRRILARCAALEQQVADAGRVPAPVDLEQIAKETTIKVLREYDADYGESMAAREVHNYILAALQRAREEGAGA